MEKNKSVIYNIIISIVSVAVVATASGIFTNFNKDWYDSLQKSVLNPPGYVFSIVWGALYILIAIGIFFALQKGITKKTVVYYMINGVLNILWCLFFFTLKMPEVAFFVLLINVVFAWLLIMSLFGISKLSFWLTLPYGLWLAYALILNYFIIMLN